MGNMCLKLTVYLGLLLILHVGVSLLWPNREIDGIRERFGAALGKKVDVLYLSDSSTWYSERDPLSDRQSTASMLRIQMPDANICDIALAGHDMDEFLEQVRFVLARGDNPECVILAVNLFSFCEPWDLTPYFQFSVEKIALRHSPLLLTLCYRPFTSFGLFDITPVRIEEFHRFALHVRGAGERPLGEVRRQILEAKDWVEGGRCFYRWRGVFDVSQDNRQLRALLECARCLQGAGIRLCVYVTPICYEFGLECEGEAFARSVARNVDFITGVAEEAGCFVLDLSRNLSLEYFVLEPVPTVHLSAAGRNWVAEQIEVFLERVWSRGG